MLMLSEPQRDLVRDKGTVLGRSLMGLLFFAGGLNMLFIIGPTGVAEYFSSLGIPFANILVWIVIATKIIAGGAVIIGKRVGLASAVLIGFTALATMFAHQSFQDPGLMKNLAIIGGLLYLIAFGPGGSNIKMRNVL